MKKYFLLLSFISLSLISSIYAQTTAATFTPTTIGWYRIASLVGPQGGRVEIFNNYDNRITDIEFQYNIGGWGVGGSIQQTRYSSYNTGNIDQIRVSSDGTWNTFLDIHINSATDPGPILISGFGAMMPVLIPSPVVGATPGSTSVNVLTVQHGFNTTQGATFAQTGGNVGIGTVDTHGYKLAVNGSAIATSVTVKSYGTWPDYVFKPAYHLPTLTEIKSYIDKNQHLPDMPSEKEVAKDGVNLGEMNRLLVKKVEELTLYLIEKDKEAVAQKKANTELERRVEKLEKLLKK